MAGTGAARPAALAARDPGRARLIVATAVSAGVLGSALVALGIVHLLHADTALLAMGVFLSVQAGSIVRDRSAGGRVVTAALLVPTVLLAVSIAVLLSSSRPAEIALFIALAGGATWIRRFGPRATAIGTVAFFSYFFTLFMQPPTAELPAYCLIAVGAVATQLVARVLLRINRPRRQVAVLLRELRAASASALQGSFHPDHARTLRARLARVDEVGRALTAWQQNFRTDRHIGCDEQTLAERVLDARVDTEEVCSAVARAVDAEGRDSRRSLDRSFAHLRVVLDEHASTAQIAGSTSWARGVLADDQHSVDDRVAEYLMARCVLAHARVREIDLAHGLSPHAGEPVVAADPGRPAAKRARHWRAWSEWEPTSRFAVQAMVAASIASIAGEAISASRWYWAVLTAFVIFLGTTSRSGILTRAYRRVAGTAVGILVGVGAVFVADHNSAAFIAICVAGIFGMLYFGPLNYVYSSFFMTVMIVALYGMLGVLDHGILELRLEETIMGAVIGVLCAYLILSSNSHPALVAKVNAYFGALDDLLKAGSSRFTSPDRSSDLLSTVRALETSQADLEATVSAMSAAFLGGRHDREETAIHLMYISTRSAARFAQSAMSRDSAPADGPGAREDERVVTDAVAEVRATADIARRRLEGTPAAAAEQPGALPSVDQLPFRADSPEAAAFFALARIDWAMRRLSESVTPRGHRVGGGGHRVGWRGPAGTRNARPFLHTR